MLGSNKVNHIDVESRMWVPEMGDQGKGELINRYNVMVRWEE
jgi:hypothetical protein